MFTAEMLAKLEAQRAYFASDEHIRSRADLMRDASPSECLAEVAALCADATAMIERLDVEQQVRVLTPPLLPPDVEVLLTALWQHRC